MPPADDASTASLNGHPPAGPTVPPPPPPPASTFPLAGAGDPFERWVLGDAGDRYRREDVHRDGGLGRVWRAEDTVVGRRVALKTLRPDRAGDPALAGRLVREAEVTGRLEHPNIVPLYDLLAGPDGPAYVMRFVDGETLAEAAAGYHAAGAAGAAGPLALERLLDAFVLVCRAVGFAHGRGVLHRDLKGQNILLGRHGEVCLADWGLAKRTGDPDRPGDPSPLSPPLDGATAAGAVMGTPAFMAPEVARGEPATVGSDVYGLGAVLYQLLADRLPHTGTTPQEVLEKVKDGQPVRPIREANPAVPAALDAVCRKALSRAPADRYATAEGLADDVRRWLAGEPVAAYPEPFLARAGRWAKRHRAGVLAGVVALAVVAAVASVAAVLVWQEKERTAEQKRAAEAERDKYQAMVGVLRDYGDSLSDVVTEAETGLATGRQTVADRKAVLERAVAAAERLLAASPDDAATRGRLARLLRYTANLARVRNDRPTAEKAFAAAIGIRQKLAAGQPDAPALQLELAFLLREEAVYRTNFGQLAEAVSGLGLAAGTLAGLPPAYRDGTVARREAGLVARQQAEVDIRLGRFDAAADAAGRAADLFAGLAIAPPAERHFLDATLQGMALVQQAVAWREAARAAGGDDYRPALAAHDEALSVLRLAAEIDERPDVRTNYHLAVLERARTGRLAGRPVADLLSGVERAVAAWRGLAAADPGVATQRQLLAQGLTLQADLRATVADDPTACERALIDLADALKLTDRLRAEAPDRPAYWADAALALSARAGLMTAPDAVAADRKTAGQAARAAFRRGPDDALLRRLADDLTRAADGR